MPENPLVSLMLARIRAGGPITAAEYIDLALYDPEYGYYATAPKRSGRDGDFYTSVDLGPLFGETIALQIEEMWRLLPQHGARRAELIEAAAGDGRLTRDILDAAARRHPELYQHLTVTLVERSAAARARHAEVLAAHAQRCAGSGADLPLHVTGVILANELLDALPVHIVVGSDSGPREIYVTECNGALAEIDGPLSDPAIAEYIGREGIVLAPGMRAEVGLAAVEWVARAAAALDAGFLLLFDYGLTAPELYSDARPAGTLTSYSRHTSGANRWLANPGAADITAHVNLSAVTRAAEAAGLVAIGMTDQTYFLLSLGLAERLPSGAGAAAATTRRSAKTLLMPGGLGSTMKVLAFAKSVGRPQLRGFSSARVT